MKKNKLLVYFLIIITVLFMSIGFSAYNNNLYVDNLSFVVRTLKNIRITGINLSSNNKSLSNYEEYSTNDVALSFNLEDNSSSITYQIDITNYGNVEMGILNITGLDNSDLDYVIENYNIKDKICDEDGLCINNITKSIYVTFKYKEGISKSDRYDINLEFDFREFKKITYDGVELDESFPTEVLEGDNLIIDFDGYYIGDLSVIIDSLPLVNPSFENQVLTINNIEDDVLIKLISYQKEIEESNYAGKEIADTISMIQTIEGALNEIYEMSRRMYELSYNSSIKDYNEIDFSAICLEYSQLVDEINNVSEWTEFNWIKVLSEDKTYEVVLTNYTFLIELKKVNAEVIGAEKVNFQSKEEAYENIEKVENIMKKVKNIITYYDNYESLMLLLGDYYENIYYEISALRSLNETNKRITMAGLHEIEVFLTKIKESEENLKINFNNLETTYLETSKIESYKLGINVVIEICNFKNKYLLKGDYLDEINLSLDTLGQNGNLYMTFTSEEEITKSIEDVTYSINKVQTLFNSLF